MGPEVYDQVVACLYDAAIGAGPWNLALDTLARELDLWSVQVAGVAKNAGRLLFRHEGGPAATNDRARSQSPNKRALARCIALPTGQWVHSHDDVSDGPSSLEDLTHAHGGRHASVKKVLESDRALVLLSAVRDVDRAPLTAQELAHLDRVSLHLSRALRHGRELKRTAPGGEAPKRLLDQFTFPMFLVDEQRVIHACNTSGHAMLRAETLLEDRAGTLACRDPECDALLAQAVRALQLSAPAAPGLPARKFARLKKSDGSPIGLYAVAIRPEGAMGVFGPLPLALLIFHDPRQQLALDPVIVGEMFELSRAEAKVAVMLALGKAPDEIAAAGRISVSTVRAQIKSIFAKTGVSRQSELVALLRGMPGVTRAAP